MNNITPAMIDMIFDLEGGMLSGDYPFELWHALVQRVPQLAEDSHIGILPLRQPETCTDVTLARRTKLILRMSTPTVEHAGNLSGQRFELGDGYLQLASWKTRAIQHAPTLHAQLVSGSSEEVQFMEYIANQLSGMGIKGQMICGKARTLTGKSLLIRGYDLVLHDLTAEASLQLQYFGIGEARQFGCGIFVPYKVISGLE